MNGGAMDHGLSHDETGLPHDEGAAKTLKSIETGGYHLLMIARRRISEALDHMDEGAFRSAHEMLNAATQTMVPLAMAEGNIAIADARLIRAENIEVGMVLQGLGEVTDVDTGDECGPDCTGHVRVTVEEHELRFQTGQELYVAHEETEAEAS